MIHYGCVNNKPVKKQAWVIIFTSVHNRRNGSDFNTRFCLNIISTSISFQHFYDWFFYSKQNTLLFIHSKATVVSVLKKSMNVLWGWRTCSVRSGQKVGVPCVQMPSVVSYYFQIQLCPRLILLLSSVPLHVCPPVPLLISSAASDYVLNKQGHFCPWGFLLVRENKGDQLTKCNQRETMTVQQNFYMQTRQGNLYFI